MTDILQTALRVIPKVKFQYRFFIERTINEFGQSVISYDDWQNVRGIVEPGVISSFGGKNIEEKDYKQFGLDASRDIITVWMSGIKVGTLTSKDCPDQVKYLGKVYNIVHVENWNSYNGWRRCFCEEAKNIEEPEPNP